MPKITKQVQAAAQQPKRSEAPVLEISMNSLCRENGSANAHLECNGVGVATICIKLGVDWDIAIKRLQQLGVKYDTRFFTLD